MLYAERHCLVRSYAYRYFFRKRCPSWPEAMSYRSPRSITGRDQNGLLFDLGNVLIFAEILNVLNKGSGGRFFRLPWDLDAPTHYEEYSTRLVYSLL